MSFLNPAMLAGLGLAAIPVLLHLLLRAKPKRLMFPALRLIQQRRRSNVRRIQLRHLWLLLLRIAVIGLIVLALCRPSLPAANYSLSRFETFTLVSIVLIAVATYFGVMEWWKRQNMARNLWLTRRTLLRGGTGVGAVLLILLAVGWPYARRVAAEIKDPTPHVAENVPVAAVFIFDTSPSMSYKQANKTRLRAGQEIAKEHLGRLPSGSKVSVTNTSESIPAAFSSDLVAAQGRIDAQEIKSTSLPLSDRLRTTLLMLDDDRRRVSSEQSSIPESKRQDRFVREVYVFTDLAKSAWREDPALKQELERLKGIGVYLIDVGETDPINIGLTGLKLSREAVPSGGIVRISTVVSSIGAVKPEQSVELHLRNIDGTWSKIGSETVTLERDSETRITFSTPIDFAKGRYRQGEVRLIGSDPFNMDDIVAFTVQSIPPIKVLIVAEAPYISKYWALMLDGLTADGKSAYRTELATTDQLLERNLAEFDVVCLINASRPSTDAWKNLHDFVERGGGLAVFLGASSSALVDDKGLERINPAAYQQEAAMSVLPAKLVASLPHRPASTMDLRKTKHTLLTRIEEFGALTDLGEADIRKYWKVEPTADASVIARYVGTTENGDQGSPALIERRIGLGRVVMMTTGVDGIAWNDLLAQEFIPAYIVFADQLTQYLAWQSSGTFNHVVGDEVALSLDRDRTLKKVLLRMPDFKQRAIDVPSESQILSLRDLTTVGSYSVDSADRDIDYHAGFSLNLPAAESDLKRLQTAELDEMLGEARYSVNRDPGSLKRNVEAGRLGQEMYGMVVAFLVAAFAMEQFTATWFYRTDDA